MIKLGDLEFKEEDFSDMNLRHDLSGGFGPSPRLVAIKANEILRQRIMKQKKVWGYLDDDFGMMVYMDDEDGPSTCTHRGRVVCEEES